MTTQENWDAPMTEDEYLNALNKRLDEQSRNRTPEESRQLFFELGILDEHGNVAEGREALVQHLLDAAARMESLP
jgi:hypothetical protein